MGVVREALTVVAAGMSMAVEETLLLLPLLPSLLPSLQRFVLGAAGVAAAALSCVCCCHKY